MNRETLKDLLDNLGDTPDEIAKNLKKLGCKGWVGEPELCPVAQYVTMQLKDSPYYVEVDGVRVLAETKSGVYRVGTNDAIMSFIKKFDDGEYEFLEMRMYKNVLLQ